MGVSDRIGRRLKLQDLHILMAVVKAGSMSKAAVLLNTGQPAISRSIRELERTLGVCLLERGPRGVEPTAYGRAVLNGGAAVFDDLRQTVKNIEFLVDPEVGEVRIGCDLSQAASFVSVVVDQLSRRYPRMQFHVVTPETDAVRDLHERNLDLLITRKFGSTTDEQLDFEVLFDGSYVVAAGSRNPWARRRRIALAELAKEPWTLPLRETPAGAAIIEAFHASGIDCPRASVFVRAALVRIGLVATGRFLTICPSSILQFPIRYPQIKPLPVELPIAPVPVGIVTLKNRMLSPVVQLFIEHAREIGRRLAKH
jgi:DNA-binding transcriptional LysR family regulator